MRILEVATFFSVWDQRSRKMRGYAGNQQAFIAGVPTNAHASMNLSKSDLRDACTA